MARSWTKAKIRATRLPLAKTLEFYIRHNRSIHEDVPDDFTVWLRVEGERFENCGSVATQDEAFNGALGIANRGKRSLRFIERSW